MSTVTPSELADLLHAASTIFGALGRALLCLDPELRIVHASEEIDRILGAGGAAAVLGQPVEAVLGPELFGVGGSLRPRCC